MIKQLLKIYRRFIQFQLIFVGIIVFVGYVTIARSAEQQLTVQNPSNNQKGESLIKVPPAANSSLKIQLNEPTKPKVKKIASPIRIDNSVSNTQVLIDVSGSMRKNDPNNVRISSLKLLVGLMPQDSKAGVWNFGTQVKPLVKSGQTNTQWKEVAYKASEKIHSKDLFTNIGKALTTASKDWGIVNNTAPIKPLVINNTANKTVSPKNKEAVLASSEARHIILLTDGMVDISKTKSKNDKERENILKTILPKLKKQNVQIHTVALSKNADTEFLKKLSTDTDGTFVPSENANDLERIFLHLYEKTTKQDTIPLIDNTFKVDDSVYELTLLIFKDKTSKNKNSEIVLPSGKKYSRRSHPKSVKWHSEKNYDLVTIRKPPIGDWSINASLDPDNRVMVVTNLKIETNRLANNVFLGEKVQLDIFLSDQNEVISDDDFLQFASISVEKSRREDRLGDSVKKWYLHDNGLRGDKIEHDGLFNLTLGKNFNPGRNEYLIKAQADTFSRELRKSFTVHDIPLLLSHLEIKEKKGKTIKRVTVVPNLEYILPDNIEMKAELINPYGERKDVTLKNDNSQQLEWYFEVSSLNPNENYAIIFHMKSHTHRGRPVNYQSKKIKLNIEQAIQQATSSTIAKPKTKAAHSVSTDKEDDDPINIDKEVIDDDPEEVEETPESTSSSVTITGVIIAIIVNILAGTMGWFYYRRWKNREDPDLIDLNGEMG